MLVDVYCDNIIIGHSQLYRLDGKENAATGTLIAADPYDQKLHATVIEGEHLGDRGQYLYVQSEAHGLIECAAISIQDYSNLLGEVEINLSGIAEPSYEACFN